ncbi:MAG: dATP/dGTP diphosphohydrolase domain-containing protein [Opitutia bacterium]
MSIGDVNSTARGSGARYNDGKPPVELLPLRLVAITMREAQCRMFMDRLADFQERSPGATERLVHRIPSGWWLEAARVFDYGRAKYAAWNWTKGMPWSVPLACAARHLIAMSECEENDAESGLPHRGHFVCNVVMLATYELTYLEGDDRPPVGSLVPSPSKWDRLWEPMS